MLTAVADRLKDQQGPLSLRLRNALVQSIKDGTLPSNRALPSERDLALGLGVSRSTVRSCLKELGDMGLVQTRHGAGTVVTAQIPKALSRLSGFTEDIRARGLTPTSDILECRTAPPGEYGQGDQRVQAYCFRMCLTDVPENRIPFPKPEGYDPRQYELLVRIYAAGWKETFDKFDPLPNHKTDSNNHGPFSTDNIGFNYDYPEASYERRREIIQEHRTYQMGWLYFIANDPRVPAEVRAAMGKWGLPKDEFADNGNWSRQLYIREARRMVGHYVMTENELLKKRPTPDSVGMGSYTIDSHNVQRYITPEGGVQNEGDIGVSTKGPYEIAYGALVPKEGECENLTVPICVSSSHIAFGSIRMEPVFMILGQSAATAAALALEAKVPVQKVPYARLKERLLQDGQVLRAPPKAVKAPRAP